MHLWTKVTVLLAAVLAPNVCATKLSHKEYRRFTNDAAYMDSNQLKARAEGNLYINIVKGLFNSRKGSIADKIDEIPCNIVLTLQTDEQQAEQFVNDIQSGNVPDIINTLGTDVVDQFKDLINIAESLPTEIIDFGKAVETDAINIFDDIEDGSITSVIEALPSEIVARITEGWAGLTDGLTDGWDGLTNGFKCDVLQECPNTDDAANSCGIPSTGAAMTTVDQMSAATNPLYPTAVATASAAAAATSSEEAQISASEAYAASTSEQSAAAAASSSSEAAAFVATRQSAAAQGPTTLSSAAPQDGQGTTLQSTQQNSPQSTAVSSMASMSDNSEKASWLAMVVLGVFGLTLWF